MSATVLVLPGDGIGPEVTAVAVDVLNFVAGDKVRLTTGLIGGAAIEQSGTPLPEETRRLALDADAVLLGAVGAPRYDNLPGELRPEAGLLGIRRLLGIPVNLRPVYLPEALLRLSPLRQDIVSEGIDFIIVRELTGGLYFGPRGRVAVQGGEQATDTMVYETEEIRRVVDYAFKLAASRSGRLVSVDKANVLECSRLWRETVSAMADTYPGVTVEHVLVDACAMKMVTNPGMFDVMVTENMFGDILSDLGGALVGSMGLLPSASLDPVRGRGLYEPVHGSAPDIAGKDMANPAAAILSVAMMLELSLGLVAEGSRIARAVQTVLESGAGTPDIAADRASAVGTVEFGRKVLQAIG